MNNGRLSKAMGVWLLVLTGVICSVRAEQSGLTNLYHFGSSQEPSDGILARCTPVLIDSTLYGVTVSGGSPLGSRGTIFKINTDGSGFALLYSFTNSIPEGANPYGSLTRVGDHLYGMTYYGGVADKGVLFRIGINGDGYTVLHPFSGAPNDGARPYYTALTLVGTSLYGMTRFGGTSDRGTIFRISADGSGFTLLHSFVGGSSDGRDPYGSLTAVGDQLYGLTQLGGMNNSGALFKIGTDGSGFEVLHSFSNGYPNNSLTLDNGILYGMTTWGGNGNYGTIFKFDTVSKTLSTLHHFSAGATDGSWPEGSLTLAGETLYGMTGWGGTNDLGTVFQINTDGTNFQLLHSFMGQPTDGTYPMQDLVFDGVNLYGTTEQGGTNDYGVLFALSVAMPVALAIQAVTPDSVIVSWPSPSTGWLPQHNTNLSTTNWALPTEAISDDGTNKFIVIKPATGTRFFRLNKGP